MTTTQRVAIVTGGMGGLGEAICMKLARMGIKVVVTYSPSNTKSEQWLKEMAARDYHFHAYPADVADYDSCAATIAKIQKEIGPIDILINNAGISMRALLKDMDVEVIQKVMDVNFYGTVYCTKLALEAVIKSKGTIAGISSIAGYRGLPGRSGYSASKFAINGWLESIRTELQDTGVNVMWVCPGFTASNIRSVALDKEGKLHGESPMDESQLMSAEECARHILNAIEKRKRTLVLTFKGKQTVWLNKLFPGWADKLVKKFFFKNGELVK